MSESTPQHATMLAEALGLAEPVIAEVTTLDPSAATPCHEMNRGQLLAHLNAVSLRILAMGKGQPAISVPDKVDDSDYATSWAERIEPITQAWAALAPSDTVVAPWRALSVQEAAPMYVAEVLVHAWDLASSAGIPFDISADLADVTTASYAQEIPPSQRAAIFQELRESLPPQAQFADPFAAAVEVGPDARPIERLVAMSGRTP